MKPKLLTSVGLFAMVAILSSSAYSQQNPVAPASPPPASASAPNNAVNPPPPSLPENVAAVAKLSSASVGDDVLITFVNNSPSMYNLSANDIVQLKDSGVPSPVIAAMLKHDNSLRNSSIPGQPAYVYNQRNYGQPQSGDPAQSSQYANQPAPAPNYGQQAPQYQAATAPTVVIPPAPQPQVEYIPVSPGPDYYWAPGYWGWDNGWNWIGGSWNLGVGIGLGYGWGWGWGGYHHGWGGYGGHRGWDGHHGFNGGGGFHGSGGGFHGSGGSHGGHR
jgi:hypothetical protein